MNKIHIICAPTACGKSSYGIELANQINGEIVNIDACQIYKDLKIITASPSKKELSMVHHHLYNFLPPTESFSVMKYIESAVPVIKSILKKGKTPILVGGTGLYIKRLSEGISIIPKISQQTIQKAGRETEGMNNVELLKYLQEKTPNTKITQPNPHRILRALYVLEETNSPIEEFHIHHTTRFFEKKMFYTTYISIEKETLYKNIDNRLEKMFKQGIIEEVENSFKKYSVSTTKIIGIKEIKDYLDKKITLTTLKEDMRRKTQEYAKRQLTWFKHQLTYEKTIIK